MNDISRTSSGPAAIPQQSKDSFTSFPDPSSTSLAQESESSIQPLHALLDGNGPSMFDENNSINVRNPQGLSAASPDDLQNLIDHHGAAELIRRLSTALAERDAHVTALTRLAEEYKIPQPRISDTASRVKQAEQRRLSLATASEDLAPSSAIGSDSSESHVQERVVDGQGTVKGITTLFGGVRKRKESLKPTPTSSRSASIPRRTHGRPRSIDTQSVHSIQAVPSNENSSWTSTLFGSSLPKRQDSLNNRLPVEMTTRHDKDQLPPTLSNQPDDPQESEWNRFLVNLSRARHQKGEDVSGGEVVGASRFGQEGNEGRKKMDQLTRLVVGGIPMKLRHPIWMELSNTIEIMRPDAYSHYLGLREGDDQEEIDAILKDVPRTLTTKYDFYSGKGNKRLKDVLVAFVGKHQDLGYTQGLNTIAGYLLLAIPTEEDAFWVLCNIVENFFPEGYFSRLDTMVSPLADNVLLREYVKEYMPQLNERMNELDIQPRYTTPIRWFFTAFSSALPETALMRLWDIWLCLPNQKHNFLFGFALALLSQNAEGIMRCEDSGEYFAYLDNTLKLPDDAELTELIKLAYKISRKMENVGEKRSEEHERLKETLGVENKVRLRKTGSMEVLVDREDGVGRELEGLGR